ncbi:ThuA domain-containing protein [Lewinella sp. JB7]|uniref:ThuA domain-containing protein n=1 Tax=Lewinella sp. JB7 TaxID=2962887 RepID=UPI0020C9AB36|nr:ThuA domain-containing protein [Lewinella sp. JB7]MCP9236188.1 ThuA domain-containing protein [Lewinella sp. JB7]
MKISVSSALLSVLFLLLFALPACGDDSETATGPARLLVFSKTDGFRHESIGAGQAAVGRMAAEHGYAVTLTEDAERFNEDTLQTYRAVVFLNTTGDVLNAEQQVAFERYIQAGGGYVGVHSATDTEYDWPWYGQLAGAYFLMHPSTPSNVQEGKFTVLEKDMWATSMFPDTFRRTDEFYSFRNISPRINAVLELDDSSYIGGENPDYHPMAWYQEFDGGRSFYTALGHTNEAYTDSTFLQHLWAGIDYASGGSNPEPLDYGKSRPEENRFAKVVLADKLDEPMEMTLLDDHRILFIQRKGEVRLYNTQTEELKTIATLPVSTKYEGGGTAEDGMLGLNKDPDFADNQWIYLFYSPVEPSVNRLSRFTMSGDELLLDSEKIMLDVPVQRQECCHTGGSIAWDADGNLYLSTGDNTNPHASNGFSPSDERPGRGPWDAQKSSANTNDLRGKIIRIHPEDDGSYTIPAGNLFPEGTEKTRPEIYTMGHRNPFRISVDQRTGYVYWGEVGPDASDPDSTRGPAGHDEVGQAREPGNFGWPHFVGNNKAYHKYDFAAGRSGELWDVNAPTNTSPNNTGLEQLPPAKEALIWYPYGPSAEFPLVGSGGRNAMAGPVFYSDDFSSAERAFPDYYNGKLLTYEWMRGWVMAVTLDENGDYKSMERFMPSFSFSNPMDMVFADNGDLYMLEYGSGWFTQNDDARLVRIEYNGGNRVPEAQLLASTMGGAAPLTVSLSADGTEDADGDELDYQWKISSDNGYDESFAGTDVEVTLSEPGIYRTVLTVDDGNGGVTTQSTDLTVGNEPPVVELDLRGSRSFYTPGRPIRYAVNVRDAEDGTLENGISADRVAFTVDYLPEGYDKVAIAQGHRSADDGALTTRGEVLIGENDCMACHKVAGESIGPSYQDIAERYTGDAGAHEMLAGKIISGGTGNWGEHVMSAHPELAAEDAASMVRYIMAQNKDTGPGLPLSGDYAIQLPEGDAGKGVYILRAAYRDQGASGLPGLTTEQTVVLRNAQLDVFGFDSYEKVRKLTYGGQNMLLPDGPGSYVTLSDVSLAGVQAVNVVAMAPKPMVNAVGGVVELHLGSADGPLIGKSDFLPPSEDMNLAAAPPVLHIPVKLPADADPSASDDLYLVLSHPSVDSGMPMIIVAVQLQLAKGQASK